jgi:hypothetical protein
LEALPKAHAKTMPEIMARDLHKKKCLTRQGFDDILGPLAHAMEYITGRGGESQGNKKLK